MSVIHAIIHNCCGDVFTGISESPSFFDVQIQTRFSSSLSFVFLEEEEDEAMHLVQCKWRASTDQIPLIFEEWIRWFLIIVESLFQFIRRSITAFGTDMWNLMDRPFDLREEAITRKKSNRAGVELPYQFVTLDEFFLSHISFLSCLRMTRFQIDKMIQMVVIHHLEKHKRRRDWTTDEKTVGLTGPRETIA